MPSKEPCRTKLRNAAIAAKSAELPKIPKELLDQIVAEGPMTGEQINATTMALKKALIERALGGELSQSPGVLPWSHRARGGRRQPAQWHERQDRSHRHWAAAHRGAARPQGQL